MAARSSALVAKTPSLPLEPIPIQPLNLAETSPVETSSQFLAVTSMAQLSTQQAAFTLGEAASLPSTIVGSVATEARPSASSPSKFLLSWTNASRKLFVERCTRSSLPRISRYGPLAAGSTVSVGQASWATCLNRRVCSCLIGREMSGRPSDKRLR